MRSYDYTNRKGVREISWDEFHVMCKGLAEDLSHKNVDAVVGIARAGLYPATLIAGMLQKELYPVRITRRRNDRVVHEHPQWIVDVPDGVKGKRVVVIDDIADLGETALLVGERVLYKGGKIVGAAVLAAHSWADPMPDHVSLLSDELVIFPWDTQILYNGEWGLHPEIRAALEDTEK